MYLHRLRLAQFRNHPATDIALSPGAVFFVGANAQGKSTLLEAVHVAATGRSFRTPREDEMIALDAAWARIRGTVRRADREEELDVTFRRGDAGGGRAGCEIRINGVAVRRGELFGHLRCVAAAPEDAAVVTGPPQERRRVLDLLLAQISPTYYDGARRYQRVLRQRNRLLRERRPAALDAWDEQLAALGAAITVRRCGVAARLSEHAAPIYRALSGGREVLAVEYVPSLIGTDAAAIERQARAALAERRAREMARGVTTLGPHRDEVRLSLNGSDLRAFGSRGQHLSAMLAVRLAERRILREEGGEEPVLLLDDVLQALDDDRRAYLLEAVGGAQALFTVTTGAAVPPAFGVQVFTVEAGTVEAVRAHFP